MSGFLKIPINGDRMCINFPLFPFLPIHIINQDKDSVGPFDGSGVYIQSLNIISSSFIGIYTEKLFYIFGTILWFFKQKKASYLAYPCRLLVGPFSESYVSPWTLVYMYS